MVRLVGRSRMKALARLLDARSFTKIVQPDSGSKEKLTAGDILREWDDADEANLLDEEDMHVFGLKPMEDPLYLVSCNFCEKTINACRYAVHAELCKYLGFQKAQVEIDDCSRHKKTTHKKRIKVSRYPSDRAVTIGVQTQIQSTKAVDSDTSKSYQDDHIGTVSSLSTLTDDSIDGMPKLDVSSVNFGFKDLSTAAVCHLKRCKLMDARIMVKSSELEMQVAKCSRYNDEQTFKKSSEAEVAELGKSHKKALDHLKTNKSSICSLPNDVPAPLATKMYFSHQSNNLRSALTLMFHKASEISSSSNVMSSEARDGKLISRKTWPTLDEHGNDFCDLKEANHQGMICTPAFGFQTETDFRPTASTPGPTTSNLAQPHTAASYGVLNR